MALFYIYNEDGTKAPYASVEEAMAQASHDAKYGFQIPNRIEHESGKLLKTKTQIKAEADKL